MTLAQELKAQSPHLYLPNKGINMYIVMWKKHNHPFVATNRRKAEEFIVELRDRIIKSKQSTHSKVNEQLFSSYDFLEEEYTLVKTVFNEKTRKYISAS